MGGSLEKARSKSKMMKKKNEISHGFCNIEEKV